MEKEIIEKGGPGSGRKPEGKSRADMDEKFHVPSDKEIGEMTHSDHVNAATDHSNKSSTASDKDTAEWHNTMASMHGDMADANKHLGEGNHREAGKMLSSANVTLRLLRAWNKQPKK